MAKKLNKCQLARLKYLSKVTVKDKSMTFDPHDYKYKATPYDCQLCEFYGGHDSKGRINCLSERCRMLKHFNDFSIDDDEENKTAEDDNNDDWDDEDDDLADLFI